MPDIIFSSMEQGITIEVDTVINDEFTSILNGTVWGSKGMLYVMHDLYNEVSQFSNHPYYIIMREGPKPIAICLVNKNKVKMLDQVYDAFYLSKLSVIKDKMRKGYGKALVSEASKYFLGLIENKGIVYATVESDNESSVKTFKKSGFDDIGSFKVLIFSRLYPKAYDNVCAADEKEFPCIRELAGNQYKDFILQDEVFPFGRDSYFVYKENNSILAGFQIEKHRWTIKRMSGFGGALLTKILPYMPVIRKVFNPKAYYFLKAGNAVICEGREDCLFKLMESVLAISGLHAVISYVDKRSTFFEKLFGYGKLGIINSFSNNEIYIYARYKGFSQPELDAFSKHPVFPSILI